MYLQQFPDIKWLRRNAAQNFSSGKDLHGNPLPFTGWPNVILNTKSFHTERDNIVGPFSLFFNLSGVSKVKVDRDWFTVSDGFYCISNSGQSYHLHIPQHEKAETFNIHFGPSLYNEVMQQLTMKEEELLENVEMPDGSHMELLPRTEHVSPELYTEIQKLRTYFQTGPGNSADIEYELTSGVLEVLLSESLGKLKKINQLRASKSTTRKELFRKVNVGIDYMHDHRLVDVDLDGISRMCGLSKFHFIRVFNELYSLTPTAYMNRLKRDKAIQLLRETDMELNQVALALGFSELSAFSRFMKRTTGKPPSSFRN